VLLQRAERNIRFLVIIPSVQYVGAIPPTVMPTFVKLRFSAANRIKDE